MAKNIFQDADIDISMLIHQCGSSVAKFVHGITCAIQSNLLQILFHDVLNCFWADPLMLPADKQCVAGICLQAVSRPDSQIPFDCILAGIVQVNYAFLIALSQNTERLFLMVHIR